ncbi:MAG: putative polysaccharide biosynthesis protein [Syntrophomonadales bacterium]|jgi:stage V sporulation protein B
MVKRTFVYGAAILFGANLLNRILGFIYQYLIMVHVGGEAYGLFAQVFPIYMMALVLTTAGIPLAVSKLVSEEVTLGNYRQARAIFRLAFGILCVSGAVVSVFLYVFAVRMAGRIIADPRVIPVLIMCTPAIFIVSVSSAYRGYFQGLQNMIPTALSQTLEQIVRVCLGFAAAMYFLPRGIAFAAMGLAFGMLAGEVVGLLTIAVQYRLNRLPRYGSREERLSSKRRTLARIWQLAAPVTFGRVLSTGLSALDAIIIPTRLQAAGFTARQATTLFGQLGGAGFTLLSFPSVFTFALATSLVPAVAEATARKSFQVIRASSAEAIRVTIIFGLPCLVTMFYFAEPLTAFFNSVSIAPVLRILALGGVFSYVQQTTTAVLQGLGKPQLPVAHSIVAAMIRIPLLYWLTGLPAWGLIGSAWAFCTSYVVVAALNITAIVRHTGMVIDLNRLCYQPLEAALGMLLFFVLLSPSQGANFIEFIEVMAAGMLVYLLILFVNRGITIGDLRRTLGF